MLEGCPFNPNKLNSKIQVKNIESSLSTIIEKFEEMKKDLIFIVSENAE